MSFQGVHINKLQGQLGGVEPSTDSIMMLIYSVALSSLPVNVNHYEPVVFHQVKDALDIGINEAFDANEEVLVYNAIKEFFRNAPEGVLYFVGVPEDMSPVSILENPSMQEAIRVSKDVKGIAIGGTIEDVDELFEMVEGVQEVINQFSVEKRLIDFVLLQGNGGDASISLSAYPDFRSKNAPNVSISIAQDPSVAAMDVGYSKYADVGAVLGMIAVRKVNENIGSVDIITKPRERKGVSNYTLTGIREWQGANLSDGREFESLSGVDQKLLTSKGYIYAGNFEGYDGVYLNGSPTAIEVSSDYAYIENNRVWNKAARAIRLALLPHVRGVVKKDATTGYILNTTISAWESRVNRALEEMLINNEISGYDSFIDPKQLPSESVPLQVRAMVVKDAIVHEFDVDLGLTNAI